MLIYSDELLTANEADPSILRQDRICWDTLTRGAAVAVSGAQVNFPGSTLSNGLTYAKWKPDVLPATAEVGNPDRLNCDYMALAAHTLGSNNCTVRFQGSDAEGNYTDIAVHTPLDDSPIVLLFTEVESSFAYRVQIEDGDAEPVLGVFYVGVSMVMERSVNFGFKPPELNRDTRVKPIKTVSGAFAGRSVETAGNKTMPSWSNLSNDFYRRYFQPFSEAAEKYPFFAVFLPSPNLEPVSLTLDFIEREYATRPYAEQRDGGVIYGWTPGGFNVSPSKSGVRDLVNVSMDIEGLARG